VELLKTSQVDFQSLNDQSFDIYIGVEGKQKRSTFLREHISLNGATNILIKFKENFSFIKRNGKENGKEVIAISPDDRGGITNALTEAINSLGNKEFISILIDYSCMSKIWYGAIIEHIITSGNLSENLILYFSYTPTKFEPYKKPRMLKSIKSIFSTFTQNNQQKPVALLLGLGCEAGLAKKVIKKVKPGKTFFFCADPAFDNQYKECVYETNAELLESEANSNTCSYPAFDYDKIDAIVTSVVLELRLNYNVVIAPVGPKTFTLCSMLISLRYPDVGLLQVKTEKSNRISRGEATLMPVVYQTIFQAEDDNVHY
jgi:hypothetical protein